MKTMNPLAKFKAGSKGSPQKSLAKFAALALSLAFAQGLALAPQAVAAECNGTNCGGGGGAYVCTLPNGKKVSMLVDLWEAENTPFYGQKVKISYSNIDPELQFEAAMKKLAAVNPDLADDIRVEKKNILSNAKALPSHIEIPLPPDLQLIYSPKSCPPKGMMYFDTNNSDGANESPAHLDIDKPIFDALRTKTDVAAAWAHEAIYKVFRDTMGHTDSKLTRRLVGCLFSASSDCLHLREHAFRTKVGGVAFQCKDSNLNVTVVPNVGSRIINGDSIDLSKVRNLRSDESVSIYIHEMYGSAAPLHHTVMKQTTLGVSTSISKKIWGALSVYGYEQQYDVTPMINERGQMEIVDNRSSSVGINGSMAFARPNKGYKYPPVLCKAFHGLADGSTILNGKYDKELAVEAAQNADENTPTVSTRSDESKAIQTE